MLIDCNEDEQGRTARRMIQIGKFAFWALVSVQLLLVMPVVARTSADMFLQLAFSNKAGDSGVRGGGRPASDETE